MGKLKRALSEDAFDALELVDNGELSFQDWSAKYAQLSVEDFNRFYNPDDVYAAHDCHLIAGEDGCDHPSHLGQPEYEA